METSHAIGRLKANITCFGVLERVSDRKHRLSICLRTAKDRDGRTLQTTIDGQYHVI